MLGTLEFFPDFCTIFSAVTLALIIYGGTSVAVRRRDVVRLLRLEQKMDLLLSKAGVEFNPKYDLPEDAIEALRQGNDEGAAEAYRKARGVGLDQAKAYIEEVKKSGYY